MQKNELIRMGESIYRVLDFSEQMFLLIDCLKLTMPKWVVNSDLLQYENCTEEELLSETGAVLYSLDELSAEELRYVRKHFTMVAGILAYVGDKQQRSRLIVDAALQSGVSARTVKNCLCRYLSFQNMSALAPNRRAFDRELTMDEKNIRWALNKFYYTRHKNSLSTAYTFMLKEKYCDGSGVLADTYPSFHQFRYYYRRHKSVQASCISREGMKHYQKNVRPLLGDGVQEFAPNVGVGMLDSTICDIYLVDDGGNLVGRPILTACVDAYSGLCMGYSLGWEGGTYSLRGLLMNVLADKVEHCKKHGIFITREEWDCSDLPSVMVTDKGSEYRSENFEQVVELGVTVTNLPAYRPELKGRVEKFFDLVQSQYKQHLKGRGVVEPNFQERGARDYRKDACLTMGQLEQILLHCIVYYNSKRIMENFPYTEDMIKGGIKPHANSIWNYGRTQEGCNLLSVSQEQLVLTLLPRTMGKFKRNGLIVNKLRYKHDGYVERYLQGGDVIVAYNPEDISFVWLVEKGTYTRFSLIESRYANKDLASVQKIQTFQKALVEAETDENLQAQIDLANHIQAVIAAANGGKTAKTKAVRNTRKREQDKRHRDYAKEVSL